ncbi:hypothetical protein B0H17DRAFT_1268394 [Mycena rosella]|uniref:Uncharacterized protein n=1 Tax=Mycena rosella TaxID=1033263 RepID=A0AAD7CMC1_MYCRO|nr:hypothetical protein B0H17DRAFT_1268394 [Mycena rosella]
MVVHFASNLVIHQYFLHFIPLSPPSNTSNHTNFGVQTPGFFLGALDSMGLKLGTKDGHLYPMRLIKFKVHPSVASVGCVAVSTPNGNLGPPKTIQTLGGANSILIGISEVVVNYPVLAVFGMPLRKSLLAIRNSKNVYTKNAKVVNYPVIDSTIKLKWDKETQLRDLQHAFGGTPHSACVTTCYEYLLQHRDSLPSGSAKSAPASELQYPAASQNACPAPRHDTAPCTAALRPLIPANRIPQVCDLPKSKRATAAAAAAASADGTSEASPQRNKPQVLQFLSDFLTKQLNSSFRPPQASPDVSCDPKHAATVASSADGISHSLLGLDERKNKWKNGISVRKEKQNVRKRIEPAHFKLMAK